MQTFLPHQSFRFSASVLDNQRLGKQRVEAWQILNTLAKGDSAKGWRNHPAVLMWAGYEDALRAYGRAMCQEWIKRGFNDTMLERFAGPEDYENPPWLGDTAFHDSHMSNLLRKNEAWYGRYFKGPNDLPYVWPTQTTTRKETINA